MIQAEANEKLLYEEISRLEQQLEAVFIAYESKEAKVSAIREQYLEALKGRAQLEETLLGLEPSVLGFPAESDSSAHSEPSSEGDSSSFSDDSSGSPPDSEDSLSTSSRSLSSASAISSDSSSDSLRSGHPSLGGIGPGLSTKDLRTSRDKKKAKKAKSSKGDKAVSRLDAPGGRSPVLTLAAVGGTSSAPVVVVAGTNFRYKQLQRVTAENILEFQEDVRQRNMRMVRWGMTETST